MGNLIILTKLMENKIGKRLFKRLVYVILLIFEVDKEVIINKMKASSITLEKYSKLIENNEMEIIFQDNVYKRKSELEDYTDIILPAFDKNPPKTLREAAVVIENLTGLKRSTNQISNYLKKRLQMS